MDPGLCWRDIFYNSTGVYTGPGRCLSDQNHENTDNEVKLFQYEASNLLFARAAASGSAAASITNNIGTHACNYRPGNTERKKLSMRKKKSNRHLVNISSSTDMHENAHYSQCTLSTRTFQHPSFFFCIIGWSVVVGGGGAFGILFYFVKFFCISIMGGDSSLFSTL